MSEQGPTIFNGRYELHRQLARGGMADVYLARDQLLDRPVAVKVLFNEFADDPNFVERFRREAQSAANLNHPNVVNIYDWGEERDTYFIVMEYVEGRSLAEILKAEGPLHPDRAAEVAIDVAAALGFAHRNGIVHRDMKPGNVMVAPSGQVKVADFGIATAIAGNQSELTQVGTVMGTATYFSPEQAQGKPVDPRSDLYSLGCVLYEMLTGRPPFVGDSPVAIAYQHVQDQPTPPRQLGAPIAESLEAITLKLLAKSTQNRYPSAEDLRADLRRYREGSHDIRPPAPPVAPVAAAPAAAPAPAPAPVAPAPVLQQPAPVYQQPPPVYQDATAAMPAQPPQGPPTGAYAEYYEPPRDDSVRRTIFFTVAILALGGLMIFLLVAFFNTLGGEDDPADDGEAVVGEVDVPDVLNLTLDEARSQLNELGLVPIIELQTNEEFEVNTVFDQNPDAGVVVEEGSNVTLFVSEGDGPILMLDVVNNTYENAKRDLEALGLVVTRVDVEDDEAEAGQVVEQQPVPETEVEPGDLVVLNVAVGADISLPNLAGQTDLQAQSVLLELGLRAVFVDEASETIEPDIVIRTEPGAGTSVEEGNEVIVVVSTGPADVVVPDVVGLLADSAFAQLDLVGLSYLVTTQALPAGSPNDGVVISQNPPGTVEVTPGSTITLVVGEAEEPAATTTTAPATTTTGGG